jgi:hypothetical protein
MYNMLSIGRASVFVMPCFLIPKQGIRCLPGFGSQDHGLVDIG